MAAAHLGAVVKAAVLRAGRGAWVRLRVRIRDLALYKREIALAIRRAIKGRPKPTAEDVAVFPAPEPEPTIVVEMDDREPALGPVLSCGPPSGASPSSDPFKIDVATLPPPAPSASGKKLKTSVLLGVAAGLLYLAAVLRG